MESILGEVESAAMQLPRADRARLAERLISSLDEDAAVEQAWATEIARRVQELRTGAVQPIPGEQVFAKLSQHFK